jgi:hypothetical protein
MMMTNRTLSTLLANMPRSDKRQFGNFRRAEYQTEANLRQVNLGVTY